MICKCCNEQIKLGESTCSVCGFVQLASPKADIEQLARKHREKLLSDVLIYINAYCYEEDEAGNIMGPDEELIKLSDGTALADNALHWLDMEFEELRSDRSVDLEVSIQRGRNQQLQTVRLIPQKAIGHNRIGICLTDGIRYRIAVGSSENDYVLTSVGEILI